MRVMPLNLVGIFFVDERLDWVGLRLGGAFFFPDNNFINYLSHR